MEEKAETKPVKKGGRPKGVRNKDIIWAPQAKQSEALKRLEFEVLYGGARGGGKTDAGMAWLLYEITNPLFRGLVIRLNAKDLDDWIDRAQRMYAPYGATFVGKPTQIRFPSGAIIRTGHLKDENAFNQFKGHEYQRILIEELTQIPEEMYYEQLISSCRSTVREIKSQVFCTTNPDGIGHQWVKDRWRIPDVPVSLVITKTEFGNRVFVHATVHDNPKLMEVDSNYVKQLEAISDENLKKAWLEGNWGDAVLEGAVYRAEIEALKLEGRYTEIRYDSRYPVHTYWDLGMSDATAIGFFQKIGTNWYMIDYFEDSGKGLHHYIKTLNEKGYVYGQHFAPHDIGVREWGTGESRIETAAKLGIYFTVVPKMDIDDGINAVRMKFSRLHVDAQKAGRAIEILLSYHYEKDDNMGENKRRPKHDWTSHCADMFRDWATALEPVNPKDLDTDFGLYNKDYN